MGLKYLVFYARLYEDIFLNTHDIMADVDAIYKLPIDENYEANYPKKYFTKVVLG